MRTLTIGWTIVVFNLVFVVVQGAVHQAVWSTIAIVFCQGIAVGILLQGMVVLRKTLQMIRRHERLFEDLTREEFED